MDRESSYDPNYEPVILAGKVPPVRRFLSAMAVRLYSLARWCENKSFGGMFSASIHTSIYRNEPWPGFTAGVMSTPVEDLRKQLEFDLQNKEIRESVISGMVRPRRTVEECHKIVASNTTNPEDGDLVGQRWVGPNFNEKYKDDEEI